MASPSPLPAGRSLVRAIRASLKIVNEVSDTLTDSQLSATRYELNQTLGIIRKEEESRKNSAPADHKLVVHISDFEDSDDADGETEIDKGNDAPLSIPKPYPTAPPPGQEEVDVYYVVDYGREVGIFTDNSTSTRAISGVPHGHQVRVKTWYKAATLYNSLRKRGLVVQVRP